MSAVKVLLVSIFLYTCSAEDIHTPTTIVKHALYDGQSSIIYNDSFFFSSSNISSLTFAIHAAVAAAASLDPLQLLCTIDNTHYSTTNIPLSSNIPSSVTPLNTIHIPFLIMLLYIKNDPFHNRITLQVNNNTIFSSNPSLTSTKHLLISMKTGNKLVNNNPLLIHNVHLTQNAPSYLSRSSSNTEHLGYVEILPYRMLYDHKANETEKQQLIEELGEARIAVFDQNGYSVNRGNIKFVEEATEVIHNYDGDIVVKYADGFRESDKNNILNLTNSTEFETQINLYLNKADSENVRTATVFVLSDERDVYYIWEKKGSLWDNEGVAEILTVLIIVVLVIIIISGACFHCRKRIDVFETTLPKSKGHKQRVEEAQRRKALKKQERKAKMQKYRGKYKTVTQDENEEVEIVMQSDPMDNVEMCKQ